MNCSFCLKRFLFILSLIIFSLPGGSPALADAEADYELALTEWQEGDNEQALMLMQAALDSGELQDDQLPNAYFVIGNALWELDRDEESIIFITEAIETGELAQNYLAYAYYQRGLANWYAGRNEEALEDMGQAVELSEDKGSELYFRGLIEYDIGMNEPAIGDFIRVANEYPDMLENLKSSYVWDLISWAKEEGLKDELFTFLTALVDAGYSGPDFDEVSDYLLQELALLHLERENINKALVLVYRIDTPDVILETLVDNRYQPLWEKYIYKSHAKLPEIMDTRLSTAKTKMEQDPGDPELVMSYGYYLRQAGQSKEAVDVLKKAIDNWDRFDEPEEDDILWIRNYLAYAYLDIGKNEKAFETFDRIMEVSLEDKPDVVNQYINYALSLLDAGEFERALAQVERTGLDYSSDFGDMFLLSVKACALHETGRSEEAAPIADKVFLNWKDNAWAAEVALLCLERYENAVDLFVARMDDPSERSGLLTAIQDFATGKHKLAYREELSRRFQKVVADQRVVEAIQKYGRIINIPLPATYWADF